MSRLRRLISEVHRRSLWQVLAIYAATSWVAIEVADVLTDRLGLPDWFPGFAVALLVVGLPIVLATAFVQEGPRRAPPPGDPGRWDLDIVDDGTAPESARGAVDPSAGPYTTGHVAARGGGMRSFLTWKRALLGGLFAFVGLALVTAVWMWMRVAGIGPAGTLLAKGVLEERATVVLADFRADDEALARAATEAFRVDLSQSRSIRLADQSTVNEVLNRMGLTPDAPRTPEIAREVAEREGFPAYIEGEIGRVGVGYTVSARLVSVATGEPLVSHRESAADSTDLLPAIDELSAELRERIGDSVRSLRAEPPLAQVTTSDLEALRKYSLASRLVNTGGDLTRGFSLLEEVVAADSTFAMAHAQIATILGNMGEQRQRRVDAVATAYAHRDRLTERERYGVEAAYYSNVEQDPDRVAAAYENILDLDPRDRVALNNLSDIYLYLRDYERSEALAEQAIEVDSTILTPYWNAAEAAGRRGDFEGAREYLDAFDGVTSEAGWTDAFRAMLSASEGDFEPADSLVRASVAPDPTDAMNRLILAVDLAASHATRGRLREAHGYLLDMAEVNESRGLPAEALRNLVWAALLDLHVAADTAGALERIGAALERYPMEEMAPLDRPYREMAELYAWAGDPARASAYLSAYEAEVPLSQQDNVEFVNFKLHVPSLERARGSIALAEGRLRDAVALFRRSDVGYCRLCSLPGLASAYDAAGSADSAIAVYERYLALPEPFRPWSGDAYHRAPTMLRLGELYESRDPTRAATYYSQFIQLWADADPALAGAVGAARQRLQRLVAEPGPTSRPED
ncbi:MAG TPA: hypothetical protein VK837_03560 [Longimicrobiales bacterium]|nr:hypothetical protein [Longimicrobiales bacterium]